MDTCIIRMVITVTTTVPSRSSRVRNSVKYNPQGKNRRISQADLAPVEHGLFWRRYKRYAFGSHNDVRMNVPRRILRSSDDLDPLHAEEINRSGDVDCDMNRIRIHCTTPNKPSRQPECCGSDPDPCSAWNYPASVALTLKHALSSRMPARHCVTTE